MLPKGAAGTGSGTYSSLLLSGLRSRPDVDPSIFTSPNDLRETYDVVHAVDIKHFDPALLPSIKSPLVVDVHDCYFIKGEQNFPSPDSLARKYFDAKRRVKYAPILDRADTVIVHSNYVASRLNRPNVRVVPYAVEPMTRGIAIDERPPRVIFAGRDYFRKGLPTLIKAWQRVAAVRPDAKLFIAGREFLHGRIYAKLASLRSSIKSIGDTPRLELLDIIRASRALVLPAWTEAFGIALIEAAMAGTPTIGSRTGGIPEALSDGDTGILINRGDDKALASAVLQCLEPQPPKNIIDMLAAAKFKSDDYSLDRLITNLCKIYDGGNESW